MNKVLYAAITVFTIFFQGQSCFAITLESFDGLQVLHADGLGNPVYSSVQSLTSAGGTRSISTEIYETSGGGLDVVVQGGTFDHSQNFGVKGITRIHWDGDSQATSIDSTGLGSVDLEQDGGTAFVLKGLSFDYPAQQPVALRIKLFDAADVLGETSCEGFFTLDRAYLMEDVSIPFSTLNQPGSAGICSLNNIGAILLVVDGLASATDFSVSEFATDGSCSLFPRDGGAVLDECGECFAIDDPDYNSSCSDCLGIPFGVALPGSECSTGELGVCSQGMYGPGCECTRLVNPTVELCDSLDNNCNGEVDETFPQLGEICGAGQDECAIEGTFICGASGGIKCDAEFEPSQFEECGIVIGCDGIPNSGIVPDRCGICGGDGSSCPESCSSVDISSIQYQLDGGAKDQEQLVRTISRRIRQATTKQRYRRLVRQWRQEAHILQIENWVISWQLPGISVTCGDTEFCLQSSNINQLDDYVVRSRRLRQIGMRALRALAKVSDSSRSYPRLKKQVRRKYRRNMDLVEQVPQYQSVCYLPG